MWEKFKKLIQKYNHVWILSYGIIYLYWFQYLEKNVTTKYIPVYCKLDDLIPFCEIFVIPYIIWFFYVVLIVGLLFFLDKKEFYKCCSFLFIGMSICLLICTLFPNGQNLRPTTFTNDNFFVNLVKGFYKTDTCTNVFPSIHCFNSIVIAIAVYKSDVLRKFKHYNAFFIGCVILSVSIMLSTVFIKQHSILDMFGAIILSICMYPFIYKFSYNNKTIDITNETTNNQSIEQI